MEYKNVHKSIEISNVCVFFSLPIPNHLHCSLHLIRKWCVFFFPITRISTPSAYKNRLTKRPRRIVELRCCVNQMCVSYANNRIRTNLYCQMVFQQHFSSCSLSCSRWMWPSQQNHSINTSNKNSKEQGKRPYIHSIVPFPEFYHIVSECINCFIVTAHFESWVFIICQPKAILFFFFP